MRHLFGKGNKSREESTSNDAAIDDSDRAILDLKVQKDDLVKYRKRMEAQVTKAHEAAKTLVGAGKKEQAMLALRKKKNYEQLVVDCNNQLMRLEELIGQIEFANVQKEVVGALADGVKTLKRLQQEMGGVDKINSLMDDCAEAIETQREINDALANAGISADDEDALEEYNRLVEAQQLDLLQQSSPTPVEPAVVQPAVDTPIVAPSSEPAQQAQASAQQAVPA
jgi:charged multivesicular body protein 6